MLFKRGHTSLVLSSANHVSCLSTLALDSSAFATALPLSAAPGGEGPMPAPSVFGWTLVLWPHVKFQPVLRYSSSAAWTSPKTYLASPSLGYTLC